MTIETLREELAKVSLIEDKEDRHRILDGLLLNYIGDYTVTQIFNSIPKLAINCKPIDRRE